MHRMLAVTLPHLLGCLLAAPLLAQKPSKEMADVIAAYAAKVTASALFVSERTLESVKEQEFWPSKPFEHLLVPLMKFDVDRKQRRVTCTVGQASATAEYMPRIGATLIDTDNARDHQLLMLRSYYHRFAIQRGKQPPWPPELQASNETGINLDKLAQALDDAFAEPHDKIRVHTRAVVVLHEGKLVAERYANGFHKDMPLPGWSMTKTLTHALLGAAVLQGKFDVDAPIDIDGWRGKSDPRRKITTHNLLRMNAGIAWSENYEDPTSDVLRMLFASRDHASVYANNALQTEPGAHYQYSSGATNTLCQLLRKSIDNEQDYWGLAAELFRQVGMRTAVLEADPSGTFVGSSYGYASARDWAKLGLLYLQDGFYNGFRVLPKGWVEEASKPTPDSGGRFGQHIWLNRDPDGDGPRQRRWPELPEDLMHMDGHEGQYVVISPSKQLVIVRLGCSKNGGFRLTKLLQDVHAAVGD